MKELDLKKSVANLVREYPELKEILVEIGFQDIMKPAALKLMGSIMTLPRGAVVRGIPMEKIRTALGRDLASTTTIIISHRITTLMDCDNVLVLEHGKLLQYGPPQTLLQADGLFRQIYDMQMAIGEEEPA